MMRKFKIMVATAIVIMSLVITPDVDACTAFLVSSNGRVLFGNNEDFWHPTTKMWFVPLQMEGMERCISASPISRHKAE